MSAIPTSPESHADGHDHDDHHGHGEHPFLAHHFDTPAQQFDSGKLGMWLFLATEVLFFGGLFFGSRSSSIAAATTRTTTSTTSRGTSHKFRNTTRFLYK